jgi:GWxTD domain-containing protein
MSSRINRWIWTGAVLASLTLAGACRLYNLERNLAPAYADFLSKVRYIITADERRTFLDLPDSEKPKFIDEFWKRRDPDPSTEENEFKMEYFDRMEKADKLFLGEGTAGWLTDRGRIFILFGPPTDRITRLDTADVNNRCQELWYYGNFPVVFVDANCTGTYKLVTYDLTGIRDLNLAYMHELNRAQEAAQRTSQEEKKLFEFDARLEIRERSDKRWEALAVIEVPYNRIWYKAEGTELWTTLDVTLELRDGKRDLVWENKSSTEVKFKEEELEANAGKKLKIEIPITVQDTQKIARLGQENAALFITLTNRTGNETVKKTLEIK